MRLTWLFSGGDFSSTTDTTGGSGRLLAVSNCDLSHTDKVNNRNSVNTECTFLEPAIENRTVFRTFGMLSLQDLNGSWWGNEPFINKKEEDGGYLVLKPVVQNFP